MYQEPSPEHRSEILKRYNQTERMLRSCEVLDMLAVSRTSWWRYERANLVPPARTLGGLKYWRLSSILYFIENMPASRSESCAA
jgi:predicted DNA-binding transcriptional regulator AlpA